MDLVAHCIVTDYRNCLTHACTLSQLSFDCVVIADLNAEIPHKVGYSLRIRCSLYLFQNQISLFQFLRHLLQTSIQILLGFIVHFVSVDHIHDMVQNIDSSRSQCDLLEMEPFYAFVAVDHPILASVRE